MMVPPTLALSVFGASDAFGESHAITAVVISNTVIYARHFVRRAGTSRGADVKNACMQKLAGEVRLQNDADAALTAPEP